jgi:hypothetical protein
MKCNRPFLQVIQQDLLMKTQVLAQLSIQPLQMIL